MKKAKMIAMLLSLMTVVFFSCKKDNTEYLLVNQRPEPIANEKPIVTINDNQSLMPPAQNIFPGTQNFNVMALDITPNFNGTINSLTINILPTGTSVPGYQNIEMLGVIFVNIEYGTMIGVPAMVSNSSVELKDLNFSVNKGKKYSFSFVSYICSEAVPGSIFQLSFGGIDAVSEKGDKACCTGGTVGNIMTVIKK